MDKKLARLRRARQTRLKIRELRVNRLTVYRSNTHIYANITDAGGEKVLVSAGEFVVAGVPPVASLKPVPAP